MPLSRVAAILCALAGFGVGALISLEEQALPYASEARSIAWAFAGLSLLAALLPSRARLRLTLSSATLLLSLFAVEGYLRFTSPIAAVRLPSGYDHRSRDEVVRDLREQCTECHPTFHPSRHKRRGLKIGGELRLPLATVSRSLIVHCNENEAGAYSLFESDEHGFANPLGIWSAGDADVAFIGDSFTQGACVRPAYPDLVREVFPRTLNLGNSGNGPLLALAGLREYLVDVQPRTVVWCYFEGNDPRELNEEKECELLLAYLDPGHRQGLRADQARIDRVLRKRTLTTLERLSGQAEPSRVHRSQVHRSASAPLRFTLLRQVLFQQHSRERSRSLEIRRLDAPMFEQVLSEAKATVESWGGELIFVYLSSYDSFQSGQPDPNRKAVLEVVDQVGLRLVDTYPAFAELEDPLSIFPFRLSGHYEAAGVRGVADLVLAAIAEGR